MFDRLQKKVVGAPAAWLRRQAAEKGLRIARAHRLLFEPLEARLVLEAGPLLISELMAINDDTWADGDGDYPDWIEIYNPTQAEVHLDGWYLTDDAGDLTQWEFPEDASIAAGDYQIVFASDKHPNPPAGEWHTNFKLAGEGEYLALVHADGYTIAHDYAFPRQLEDVSYGLPNATTVRDELVASGAAASYHVPGPGDDPLAWKSPGFDDSAWTDTVTLDAAGLLITEVSTGDTRFVEIQNVSDQAVDTTGWSVLVNEASSGINGVNPAAWSLPASIAHGTVLYRSDDSGDQYWGSTIDWQPEGPGWAMIIDGAGTVKDFLAWGYSAAEIASLDVSYGGLAGITVGDRWSGDGAAVGTADPGGQTEAAFVAFNDHIRGAGTHQNTTTYTPNDTPSGLLKDVETGLFTDVTLTTSEDGVSWEGTQGNPAPDTDAYDVFHGYVDFSGASGSGSSIAISGADDYTHTFSGLDTGDAVTYSFAGTAVRGRDGYTRRWTLVTLEGADSATAAHSSGTGVVVVSPTEVAIWTGENHRADQGFLAAWTDIDPGPDGQFSVVSTQYRGATPFGDATDTKAYGLSGIRLEEVAPSGPLSWLKRTGNVDTDTAGEFVRTTDSSKGAQNPELTVPFGTVIPAATGLGFSANQPEFESNIQTDVDEAMHGVNASLWTRLEFEVADVSQFDELTLRMKYDDGFVAYLNGTEVMRAGAPDSLAYDSAATDEHPDAQAVQFEDFGISDSLDALQTGTNVLAIHGLNIAAGDDDFLILPELIGSGTLAGPQYMTTPTPGAENVAGALGVVADTQFSVDRGFYDEPITVGITTDTAGAVIRYTTDGSAPTATSGSVYSEPIWINGTTTLRAAAYKPGYIPTNVDTHTYLFLDDVILQDGAGMPDTWGYVGGNLTNPPGPDYGLDPAVVSAYSATIRDDLKSVPTVSLVTDIDNWFGEGYPEGIYIDSVSIPTPVSVEFFTADGAEEFQLNGSAQIQGGGSGGTSADRWKSYKLSMRLKFKEIYGAAKLRHPLYGEDGTDWFDTLILDAQLNHTWIHPGSDQRATAKYIQDQVVADIQNGMGGWGPHGRFVHLYLNGQYWGMYTFHERPDEHFAAAYFGGEEEQYDVLKHNSSLVVNGSNATYLDLLSRVRRDMTNQANYESVLEMLDVDAFIDYMMANFYAGNEDWAHKNWYASYNREDPDGRWRFHSWDAEHVLENTTRDYTGESDGPAEIHQRLKYNPEYRLRFADRVHKHMFNDGVLTASGAAAVYQARMDEVDRAIVGESARWGDNRRPGDSYTRSDWLGTQNGMLASYFPNRSGNLLNQFRNQSDGRDLYPAVAAPEYRVNGTLQHGGEVEPTDAISMTGSGTIWYTLDGTDPRLTGGTVSGTATRFTGAPIYLGESTLVKSRVLSGSTWSALTQAQFYVGPAATAANVVVSEINYNPHDPTPEERAAGFEHGYDFEFIELQNTSGQPVDLTTAKFTRGISFDFTGSAVTKLGLGERVVIVSNPAAFAERYDTAGLRIAGQFGGKLDDTGEGLTLRDRFGQPIVDFSYNDGGGWPGRADGKGAALELIDPAAVPHTEPERTDYLEDDDHWHSSVAYGGTPGAAPAADLGVVVNEVLTHTDPPQKDTIELYNTTGSPIDLDGWYVSDSWGWQWDPYNGNYKKFRIPEGTSIPAYGYVVFDEDDFNPSGGVDPELHPEDFALDGAHGDDVWLMKADATGELTHFADHLEFDAAASGESWGRWPNGTGDPYPMITPTLDKQHPENGPNSGPRVGPLILSELHYNPNDGEDDDDLEFIEIYNSGGQTVDLTNWRIRKGIDYDFPAGKQLGPYSQLIVVPFDPDDPDKLQAFCDEYWPLDPVPQDLVILGGYSGRLSDDGERVQLQRPDEEPADEPGFIPRLLEDEVRYDNQHPWPTDADGGGDSLHRAQTDAWGNTYLSWNPQLPTPGATLFIPEWGEVVGRYVFYNGSKFDGNNTAPGAEDDDAIAPDKVALMPGETAGFANYTSYSRGINGIIVDVDGMPQGAVPDVDDFQLRMGNTNTPADWTAAPTPSGITVRPGQGTGNSDRVTIIWDDNAIQKQWLQVTVLTTDTTNLAEEDVFYFGNAIGDSGNSATDAKVNAFDMLGARDNQRTFISPAPIDFAYDFNRDARVNTYDMLIARDNQTHFLNALKLITVPMVGQGTCPTIGLAAKTGDAAAATLAEAVARDAVFEQAGAAQSGWREASPGNLTWLHQFDQTPTRQPRPQKGDGSSDLQQPWGPGIV